MRAQGNTAHWPAPQSLSSMRAHCCFCCWDRTDQERAFSGPDCAILLNCPCAPMRRCCKCGQNVQARQSRQWRLEEGAAMMTPRILRTSSMSSCERQCLSFTWVRHRHIPWSESSQHQQRKPWERITLNHTPLSIQYNKATQCRPSCTCMCLLMLPLHLLLLPSCTCMCLLMLPLHLLLGLKLQLITKTLDNKPQLIISQRQRDSHSKLPRRVQNFEQIQNRRNCWRRRQPCPEEKQER